MNKLDLHGVRHGDVEPLVENFILMNQGDFPLEIICGNSLKMIELVKKVIDKLECKTYNYRYGVILITGWN